MLYRITVVLSALSLAMFALAGCGGGASPGSSLTVDSGSVTEATTIPEVSFDNPPDFTVTGKTPLFVSDSGPALYQLDEVSGLPVNAETDSITVEETIREDGSLEWRIIDVTGESRPLFTRLTYLDTGLEPDELYRGEWGGDARAIFAAIPTPENELEIVMCPISGEEPGVSDCAGKCFARLVMTEPDKSSSLAPQDKGSDDECDMHYHTFFPFINPASLADPEDAARYQSYKTGYVAHWEGLNKEGYDNHVLGVDETLYSERDALENTYRVDNSKVFSRTSGTYCGEAVDKTLKIRFYGNFHGDYNEDGMVTVGDITELAQNFGVMSDYAALQRASTNFTNHNPFNIQSAASVRDPYNKYDGSYDGYVSVQNCNGDEQRMQNLLTVAPEESLAQYGNDLSPIAVHYNESIAYWQVKYVNKTPPTERVDYAVYDTELIRADYDRSNYPNGTILSSPVYSTTPYEGPKYYNLAAPLNYILPPLKSGLDDESRDLDPGVYDIYITPYDKLGNAGEPTFLENYTISFTQCYEPPDKPDEEPYFDGTNSFTANPYSYSIASVVLEWNQARHYTHTYYPLLGVWMQDANPVPNTHFELYCRVADPNVTMDSAWISDANATDNFVHEFVTPNYSGIIMMPGYCPDDQDVYWQPGAQYAFYLVAVNDQTGETTPHPSGVITGYLSYDPTQPVWLPDEDNSTDTEDDILNWTFGVAPDGTPGYFVYYGYAVDRETGISGYRIYYSDGSTIIPSTTLSGDMFTDSDLNTMMQNRSSYVIQYPDDLVADDPYWEYLAAKRCFFVPLDSAADRYDDLYVLVTALNGEHYIGAGAYRDGDNESRNRLVHNLKERPDAGVFERMILSSELGGDVTRTLNPEFYSGDMAYMGWYEGIDATDEGLLVGHATMDEFSYGSSNIFYPNMAGWIYGQLTTSQYNPLDADEWNFYSKVALAGALPSSGQYAVALAPDSEISCEWVKDFWSCEYTDLPQASVAYNVLSADSLVEDPDQSYLIGKAIYGLTTSGEYWGRVDYPYSILSATTGYPGMDLDTFGFPADLAPYSFGFPYSTSPIAGRMMSMCTSPR